MRRRIRVTGTVQGVGFRPFVYREARELALSGFVCNDAEGVLIEVEGPEEALEELCRRLVERPPALARVRSVESTTVPCGAGGPFEILDSETAGAATVPVTVDTATCDACLAEVDDPTDRRHGYPFTNCTNCGPRYTILRRVPYDRANTTMSSFDMCGDCRREYDDPGDRRFHAQPNACPVCGPRLQWWARDGETLQGDGALAAAIGALRRGGIVGVKGIGGYHLAVNAGNAAAVGELRRRKARDEKPFAVMAPDLASAKALCDLDAEASEALTSFRRPIVIAPRVEGARVAPGVAPGLPELGVMLPYSPLHHLLLRGVGEPLVMTSGNLSDEPIAHDDGDARERLGPLVDGILSHDRPIYVRCDDSVVRSRPGRKIQVLRRSRGFAPEPLPLRSAPPRAVLAVGAELKSTIAVTVGSSVVASHHIGDLEQLPTYRSFLQAVEHLCALYGITPEVVAHDLHPEYLSTKFALDLELEPVAVQHHHAHVASCLAEHGWTRPVVGIAFDGLGFGCDRTLWGGELLVADLRGFERAGHLRPVAMPGGAAAIREPWRMGVAWALEAGVDAQFDDPRAAAVAAVVRAGRGPVTTSAGRLFDAVASLLGIRHAVSYEAQAAVELEACARSVRREDAPAYPVSVATSAEGLIVIDPAPLVRAAVADCRRGVDLPVVSAGFHEALGRAAAAAAVQVARARDIGAVALSGGVFQNSRLSEVVEDAISEAGLQVLVHRDVPPNDGGISIGQAAIAAASL